MDLDNSLASSWVAVSDNSQALSINYFNTLFHISLYPNPVENLLIVQSNTSSVNKVEIFNIEGQQILEFYSDRQRIEIDLTQIPSGLYFAKISSGNDVIAKKIIKK